MSPRKKEKPLTLPNPDPKLQQKGSSAKKTSVGMSVKPSRSSKKNSVEVVVTNKKVSTRSSLSKTSTDLQGLVKKNLYELVNDIIGPVRVILANFVILLVFLIAEQTLFWIFDRFGQEIKTRKPFVVEILDIVQIISIISISVYFVTSGISNLRDQWQISQEIGRRAGLK